MLFHNQYFTLKQFNYNTLYLNVYKLVYSSNTKGRDKQFYNVPNYKTNFRIRFCRKNINISIMNCMTNLMETSLNNKQLHKL